MEARWEDFDSAKNCVHVCDADEVRLYFSQLTGALTALRVALRERAGASGTEARATGALLDRLVETYRLLALRYLHDRPGDGLRIDSTDSGFFHFSTLMDLEVDLPGRDRALAPLPPAADLRREIAEHIVRHAAMPRPAHERLARRAYLEGLQPERIWSDFVPGRLVPLPGTSSERTFFWSFGTYDRTLNRPFIYMMYLVQHGGGPPFGASPRDLTRLQDEARGLASGRLSLLAFSRQLDELGLPVSPHLVKRLIIGPYWSPSFTENEGELALLFEPLAARCPFALRWEAETLVSDRQQRVGQGLLSRGRVRQVFWIPRDLDLSTRGVSHLERGVVLPHWLAQDASVAGLWPGHRLFAIDAAGGVHPVRS